MPLRPCTPPDGTALALRAAVSTTGERVGGERVGLVGRSVWISISPATAYPSVFPMAETCARDRPTSTPCGGHLARSTWQGHSCVLCSHHVQFTRPHRVA